MNEYLLADIHLQVDRQYTDSQVAIEILVKTMIRELEGNKLDQLIFIARFLNGNDQNHIAEVCHLQKTNISRRVNRIRRKLIKFADGYDLSVRPKFSQKKLGKETEEEKQHRLFLRRIKQKLRRLSGSCKLHAATNR